MDKTIGSDGGFGWKIFSGGDAGDAVSGVFGAASMRERELATDGGNLKSSKHPGILEWGFPAGSPVGGKLVCSFQISLSSKVDADLPYTLLKTSRRQSGRGVDARSGSDEFDPDSFYSYVNKEEVESFIARKPHIEKMLNELSVFLNKTYGVTESRVKHIADDYYGYDTLKVTPNFDTKDWERLMKMLREIMVAFCYPMGVSPSEDIMISI